MKVPIYLDLTDELRAMVLTSTDDLMYTLQFRLGYIAGKLNIRLPKMVFLKEPWNRNENDDHPLAFAGYRLFVEFESEKDAVAFKLGWSEQ